MATPLHVVRDIDVAHETRSTLDRMGLSPHGGRLVGRANGRTLVFVMPTDIWAFEARGGRSFVHAPQGRLEVDLSLVEVEPLLGVPFLRVHFNWLVRLSKVRELCCDNDVAKLFVGETITGGSRERRGIEVPVARSRMKDVRRELLADTFGLRPWASKKGPSPDSV